MAEEHNPKQIAGFAAADLIEDGTVVGLGTGSTVWFTLVRLAERIAQEGLRVQGVPTSEDTHAKATELGIPLTTLEEVEAIDLTIDGADEIDASFRMIKGGGGALLREKVVASISRREAIVVGPTKVVDRLGTTFKLPVEVVPFARAHRRRLLELGLVPGTRVHLVRRSALQGLLEVEVRGSRLSLRSAEAHHVTVEVVDG